MSVPPIFERCNCLANIGCWAVCADCSIDAEISTVQFIVDVVCFVGGFVGDYVVSLLIFPPGQV